MDIFMIIEQIKDKVELLLHWQLELKIACRGHYRSAYRHNYLHNMFGILSIFFATIAGSSALSNYLSNYTEISYSHDLQLISVIAAVLTAIFSSVQTFMQFSEKAEQHRAAGVKYAGLLRKIERHQVHFCTDDTKHEQWCDEFLEEWEEIARDYQSVPSSLWEKLEKELIYALDENEKKRTV